MLAQYKTKTNIGVGLGLVIQFAGRMLMDEHSTAAIGVLLVFGGFLAFIWGCAQYAKGKGYTGWLGLFGILSIIGLIVLVILPDKHKTATA